VFLLLFTAIIKYELLEPVIQNHINSDPDFKILKGVLIKYKGTAEVVVIPDGVTTIGQQAFRDCTGITSITIPDSVTTIGSKAFHDCTGLTSITIPDSVTTIDSAAFYDCTGLTSVTIPDSVTSIGAYAFNGCTDVTSITIGNSVTSIGWCAFYHCTGLTEITIPDSVTSIDYLSFYGCTNLRHISVPGHFTDQQILDLGLPLECMIERRELAILPPWYDLECLARTDNFQLNRVDQAVRNLLIAFSMCMECYPVKLPERVMKKLYDLMRREYLPSSEITKDILADTPDSQERKDKVAAYEQEVSLLLTQSPEQGG